MADDYKKYLPDVRVENMTTHSGNTAPNQFVIYTDDATIFQSYNSIIAIKLRRPGFTRPEVILGRNWDCSNTTMKYLGQFLGHGAAQTRKKIEKGTYRYEENLK